MSLSKPMLKELLLLLAGKLCSRAGGVVEYDLSETSATSSNPRPCCLLRFDLETGSDRLDSSIRASPHYKPPPLRRRSSFSSRC